MLICSKCKENKNEEKFFVDSEYPNQCIDCFNKKQLNEYLQPPLTKAMKGLTAQNKKMLIKEMIKIHYFNLQKEKVKNDQLAHREKGNKISKEPFQESETNEQGTESAFAAINC